MATTVVLTSVIKAEAPATTIWVNFNDGTQLEFPSLVDLQLWAREPDQDQFLTKRLCIAYALGRSDTLSNVTSVSNKNFTFDLTQNNPVRIQ